MEIHFSTLISAPKKVISFFDNILKISHPEVLENNYPNNEFKLFLFSFEKINIFYQARFTIEKK